MLARFAAACVRAGAAVVLVRPGNKTSSSKRAAIALGDLAYYGIAEVARRWALVGRVAEYVLGTGVHDTNLQIGRSAGHSSRWSVRVRPDQGAEAGRPGPTRR